MKGSLPRHVQPAAIVVAALLVCVGAAGCRGTEQSPPKKQPAPQLKTLTLSHAGTAKAVVGTDIDAMSLMGCCVP